MFYNIGLKTNLFTFKFSGWRELFYFRERFVELFDEKARELNKLESEYADCKAKLETANRKLVESDYKGTAATE